MFICQFCGQEFKTIKARASHYRKHKEYKKIKEEAQIEKEKLKTQTNIKSPCGIHFLSHKNKLSHMAKCSHCIKYKDDFISQFETDIINLYENYSINSIVNIIKTAYDDDHDIICWSSVSKILKRNNIQIRNVEDSKKILSSETQRKATCIEKYGAEHIWSKNSSLYQSKIQNCLDRYGAKNIFASKYFKDKITYNDEYWINKYGITRNELLSNKAKFMWDNYDDDQKIDHLSRSMWSNRVNQKGKSMLEESFIKECSNHLSKDIIPQYRITPYFVDGLISGTNIIVEVFGDYWHCNPKFYKKDDIISFPGGKSKVEDIWIKDKKRLDYLVDMGYVVFIFWECDIRSKNYDFEAIENKIYL